MLMFLLSRAPQPISTPSVCKHRGFYAVNLHFYANILRIFAFSFSSFAFRAVRTRLSSAWMPPSFGAYFSASTRSCSASSSSFLAMLASARR